MDFVQIYNYYVIYSPSTTYFFKKQLLISFFQRFTGWKRIKKNGNRKLRHPCFLVNFLVNLLVNFLVNFLLFPKAHAE